MQKIITTIFLTFIILSSVFGQVSKKKIDALHLPWIKFNWVGDSLGSKYFDKAAMTIPVKIDNLPYNNLAAQFDLGAEVTLLYDNPLKPFLKSHPGLLKKIDTGWSYNLDNVHKGRFLRGVDLKLDNALFPNRNIAFVYDYGDSVSMDSVKNPGPKIIGTIGPDLFQNRILVIDYPNKRICIIDSLPALIVKNANFVPVKIREGRIKIPFIIANQEHDIMFDTGSSIFSIYSSVENAAFFTTQTELITDTIIGQSWGQKAAIYGKKITTDVKLGNHKMPPATIFYKEDKNEKTFEDEEKIIGLTGNAYFLNNIIIIDYKNKRFGVI